MTESNTNLQITAKVKSATVGETPEIFKYELANETPGSLLDYLGNGDSEMQKYITECFMGGHKSRARNMVVGGYLKAGEVHNIPALIVAGKEASSNRGASGQALVVHKELTALIVDFATSNGISAEGAKTVRRLVVSSAGLALASAAHKGKILAMVNTISDALTDEQLEYFADPLDKILEACSSPESTDF